MASQDLFQSNADATKKLAIDVDGLTTATTRLLTIPDQNIDLTPGSGSFAAAGGGGMITGISKNSGANVNAANRSVLNLIEGAGVALTIADDAGGDEVDVTIAADGILTDSQWSANGDLIVGGGVGIAGLLSVGADGQVLTADSGEPDGMKWAAAGGGGGLDQQGAGTFSTSGAGANAGGNLGHANHYMTASGAGAFVHGATSPYYTYANTIQATSSGAWAGGFVYGAGVARKISAQAVGALAHGYAFYGDIVASATGATALGHALGGGQSITASGDGSLAVGRADTASITASGVNSVQFGEGVNAEPTSLQVGDTTVGIRLTGSGAAPTNNLHNGDIWVSTGYVYIRSNGVSVKIT